MEECHVIIPLSDFKFIRRSGNGEAIAIYKHNCIQIHSFRTGSLISSIVVRPTQSSFSVCVAKAAQKAPVVPPQLRPTITDLSFSDRFIAFRLKYPFPEQYSVYVINVYDACVVQTFQVDSSCSKIVLDNHDSMIALFSSDLVNIYRICDRLELHQFSEVKTCVFGSPAGIFALVSLDRVVQLYLQADFSPLQSLAGFYNVLVSSNGLCWAAFNQDLVRIGGLSTDFFDIPLEDKKVMFLDDLFLYLFEPSSELMHRISLADHAAVSQDLPFSLAIVGTIHGSELHIVKKHQHNVHCVCLPIWSCVS